MSRFTTSYNNISLFDLLGYHVKEVKKYVAETDGYERVRIEYQALNDATSEVNNQREIIHLYYDENKVVKTGYWLR